jgi:hypothetical protein
MSNLASERQRNRDILTAGVGHMLTIPVSARAERLIVNLIAGAEDVRRYDARGASGLGSPGGAFRHVRHMLRIKKRAFMRYAVRDLGAVPREAARLARLLGTPLAYLSDAHETEARRWLRRQELRSRRAA